MFIVSLNDTTLLNIMLEAEKVHGHKLLFVRESDLTRINTKIEPGEISGVIIDESISIETMLRFLRINRSLKITNQDFVVAVLVSRFPLRGKTLARYSISESELLNLGVALIGRKPILHDVLTYLFKKLDEISSVKNRSKANRKCSCGAKHTTFPDSHLYFCDLA